MLGYVSDNVQNDNVPHVLVGLGFLSMMSLTGGVTDKLQELLELLFAPKNISDVGVGRPGGVVFVVGPNSFIRSSAESNVKTIKINKIVK